MAKIKVYLASQIFAECWRDYNEKLANRIEEEFPDIELYVPQRNKSINDKTKCATAEDIAYGDFTNNLDHDDIVVAVVDGDTPGIGTTVEIGYFARMCQEEIERTGSTKKKIIALYTDSRECSSTVNNAKNEMLHSVAECQYSYLNLLLVGAIKRYGVICRDIEQVLEELDKAIQEQKKDKIEEIMVLDSGWDPAANKMYTRKMIRYADGSISTGIEYE
jgi:nucleoside 2-deoxyribosyltransferase